MKKKTLPYQSFDAQDAGAQYLEDLATGYWFSEVLFTALEMDLFSHVGIEGTTVEELSRALDAKPHGVDRFLQALERGVRLDKDRIASMVHEVEQQINELLVEVPLDSGNCS